MPQETNLKEALIEVIMSCKNNPYKISELRSIRLYMVQQIHDTLILSRGESIKKMDNQTLMLYQEIQWH